MKNSPNQTNFRKPIIGKTFKIFFSALQCRLDCDPGYVSHKTPIITCVDGRYEPQPANTFVCKPAVAVIFSSKGEVEVFGEDKKCNQKIGKFPIFEGTGRSLDLLDEQLVLLGGKNHNFEYKKIHMPRKGLLGMKYTTEVSPIGKSPIGHTSHSYGNQLLTIGGEFKSMAKLANSVWNSLDMRWQNRSKFDKPAMGACSVKLEKDIFLLIGGIGKNEIGRNAEMNIVLKLNITEETVVELPPMNSNRAFHACEVFEKKILISGGLKNKNAVTDEIYSLDTNKSTSLQQRNSLKRHHHHLLALGSTIFAIGGKSGRNAVRQIKWFDWTTETWKAHDQSLKSGDISDLAVSAFPRTAVDCHLGCNCGTTTNGRIIGGSEATVIVLNQSIFKQ